MTKQRDLKTLIRQRMAATGEPYTLARGRVLAQRGAVAEAPAVDVPQLEPVLPEAPVGSGPRRVQAAVLKAMTTNARVRILGDEREVTLRSDVAYRLVPGHVLDVELEREWQHRGAAYASGRVLDARLDVRRLGLLPIPLHARGTERRTPLLAKDSHLDAGTKAYFREWFGPEIPVFAMDEVAYVHPEDTREDRYDDEDVVSVAVALRSGGDVDGARRMLMDAVATELRFLDAHAHLGNLEFDRDPKTALRHYEVGVAIGDLSVGPEFRGILPWSILENRAYLRCLHGQGLALWKLGRLGDAESVMRRMLRLNPNDNQGARICLSDLRRGQSYELATADA